MVVHTSDPSLSLWVRDCCGLHSKLQNSPRTRESHLITTKCNSKCSHIIVIILSWWGRWLSTTLFIEIVNQVLTFCLIGRHCLLLLIGVCKTYTGQSSKVSFFSLKKYFILLIAQSDYQVARQVTVCLVFKHQDQEIIQGSAGCLAHKGTCSSPLSLSLICSTCVVEEENCFLQVAFWPLYI